MPRDPKALAMQRVAKAVETDRKAVEARKRTLANLQSEVAKAVGQGVPKYPLANLTGYEWHTIHKWCQRVRAEKERKG